MKDEIKLLEQMAKESLDVAKTAMTQAKERHYKEASISPQTGQGRLYHRNAARNLEDGVAKIKTAIGYVTKAKKDTKKIKELETV